MSSAETTAVTPGERRRVRWAALEQPVLYGAAAVSYVAIGVFVTAFLLTWVVAFAWLLLWVWVLPAAVRRLIR